MNCGEDDSPPYVSASTYQPGPYSYSIASSASSSSASVWSDAASQASDDSSVLGGPDSDSSEYYNNPHTTSSIVCEASQTAPTTTTTTTTATQWPQHKLPSAVEVAPEQRRHPRRTSAAGCPPSLVRQCDRKVTFVDSLVDSSAQIVEAIWPLSSVVCRNEMGNKAVLPLRTFIQETLRRSRTSYSTLQVALYYLILIKPHVPKQDFTMEQSDDGHSFRALQCGRRMFLAALILASKYLQDRNYSSRAWSKISGLNTLEINQNEMAFLLAVNWRIHITETVYQRWTDIVLKYTPSLPPSPGSSCPILATQTAEWKAIILKLNPELDNLEVAPISPAATAYVKSISSCPQSFLPLVADRSTSGYGSNESTPTPKYYTPSIMEPSPTSYASSRPAPALGLLPTPRLTPQSTGFNTPAVSAASYMLGKSSSMGFAMAQASSLSTAQISDRWQTSSPQSYVSCRRSSLANSVSSMSSPESMVSDTSSRSSRSSSISSASGLMSAPLSSKLDVQARCRYAKLCSEKMNRIPEVYCDEGPTSSPDSYAGPVGKEFLDLSLSTPLARQQIDSEYEEAARALQDLHNFPRSSPNRGAKRSRAPSMDNPLQDNVRDILSGSYQSVESWSETLVRSRVSPTQVAVRSASERKRVCCATEARDTSTSSLHPAFGGIGGPGMWSGILN